MRNEILDRAICVFRSNLDLMDSLDWSHDQELAALIQDFIDLVDEKLDYLEEFVD